MNKSLLVSCILLASCGDFGTFTANPDYCGLNDGDAYCGRVAPGKPYCVVGTQSCVDAAGIDASDPYGCVAELPSTECRDQCGADGSKDGDVCVDPTDPTPESESSSTGDMSTSATTGTTETESETEEPSTTTGPECSETLPCLDAEAPFCVEGKCTTCDAAASPDEACAMLDETTPLCVGDSCVQCSAENADACGGTTPLCDDEANTCVGCSFHEECQAVGSPACNIATGACFDPAAVTEVNAGTDDTLQPAIDAVADGAEHAIVLTGGGQNHTVTIDGGKTIAIVSDSTSVREVRGNSGSPTLQVSGAGTTAYLHRVALTLNGDDVGVSVTSSATLYADSTRIAQNSGGGITLASGTSGFLRNSMVGRNGDQFASTTGISSSGSLEVLYTSVVANDGDGADSLECSGGTAVVRNSIFVGASMGSIECPSVAASNSAFDEAITGDGNGNVGALDPGWFESVAGADFRLTASGEAEFSDVAVWQLGDPPFDFDGDARPSEDGASDFAGADVP